MYWIGKGSLLVGSKVLSSGQKVPKKLRGKLTDKALQEFLSDVDPNEPKKTVEKKPAAKKPESKKPEAKKQKKGS